MVSTAQHAGQVNLAIPSSLSLSTCSCVLVVSAACVLQHAVAAGVPSTLLVPGLMCQPSAHEPYRVSLST
jgi:hypothetical protein